MRLDGRLRTCRVATLQGGVDGVVLFQQLIPGGALFEHHAAVIKHTLLQQLIHRPHHMQHNHVVACLDNRQVKFGVQTGLILGQAFAVCQFQLVKKRLNTL